MSLDSFFDNKSILILDKSAKTENDRTWSFWSKQADVFDSIVHHQWPILSYLSDRIDLTKNVQPYLYKMIRGIDFYNFCLDHLQTCANIELKTATISGYREHEDQVTVATPETVYHAYTVFKSYPEKLDALPDHFIWQHFKGWIIQTPTESFDPDRAIFMDFRVDQGDETRFFYVLPTSPTRALVEIAIFSEKIPEPSYYDRFIKSYISEKLDIDNYEILEEEVGAIPMTTHDFRSHDTDRIRGIGTNGGSVKASSGYAFTRIQKNTQRIIQALKNGESFVGTHTRHDFYDKVMLNAIVTGKTTGKDVFDGLFRRVDVKTILRFLDGEATVLDDLKVFTGPPTYPFLKAFVEELL